jgi:hypothetical protein
VGPETTDRNQQYRVLADSQYPQWIRRAQPTIATRQPGRWPFYSTLSMAHRALVLVQFCALRNAALSRGKIATVGENGNSVLGNFSFTQRFAQIGVNVFC